MTEVMRQITGWLADHDARLHRFRTPLPLSALADETGIAIDALRLTLTHNDAPPFHCWPHTYAGRSSRNKPYCLRLNGPDTVGLDWEDSMVGAVEAAFRLAGYQTARELGNPGHLAALVRKPDLSQLLPGTNLRDLWALHRDGQQIDLWIIEAKGKEAYEFDHYSVAEALAQLFPVYAAPLTALLGTPRQAGHGLCWTLAQQLDRAWRAQGFTPRITLGLLLPASAPDVVWSGGKVRQLAGNMYHRRLAALQHFLATGETAAQTGKYTYQRAFGAVLEELEQAVGIRARRVGARTSVSPTFITRHSATRTFVTDRSSGLNGRSSESHRAPTDENPVRPAHRCAGLCELRRYLATKVPSADPPLRPSYRRLELLEKDV